jgi:hypothetical protein
VTPFNLLHHLWTKAVGTPYYEKREWAQLEALILDAYGGPPHKSVGPIREYRTALDLEAFDFVLDLFPASKLPMTPAGRLSVVQELADLARGREVDEEGNVVSEGRELTDKEKTVLVKILETLP